MPLPSVTIVPRDELAVLSSATSAPPPPAAVPADVEADGDGAAGLAGSGVDDPQAVVSTRTAAASAVVLMDRVRIMMTSSISTPGWRPCRIRLPA
jgi:hypothetical protein